MSFDVTANHPDRVLTLCPDRGSVKVSAFPAAAVRAGPRWWRIVKQASGVFQQVPLYIFKHGQDILAIRSHLIEKFTLGIETVFTFDDSPADHGAPTTGTYYIEGAVANIANNFSLGVWNSAHNTQYNMTWFDDPISSDEFGWGWGFGPNAPANSGPDVFDGANAHTTITRLNMDGGFVASYSFLAVEPKTGASWGHGGADGVPNHIPGFGTPTLRVYYDRRGGQDIDMDEFRIALSPFIPEPASFALLGLASFLMLRRRV